MRITKFKHACLLIEEDGARILLDPGAFSEGFENLENVNAIFITHQHQDHFVIDNIKALQVKNPGVAIYADEASAKLLSAAGVTATPLHGNNAFEVAGVAVEAVGELHAQIHAGIERIPNLGYFIAGKFFYPGDAFTSPGHPVKVLAIPAGAPWLKIGEAIDYLLSVKPGRAFPVHDEVLSQTGKNVQFGALAGYAEHNDIAWQVPENGVAFEV